MSSLLTQESRLEDIEIEIPCESNSGCDRPAEWVVRPSCGCPVGLFCNKHKVNLERWLKVWVERGSVAVCTICGAREVEVVFERLKK